MTEDAAPKLKAVRLSAQRSLTAYGVLVEPIPKWKPFAFHQTLARALEWVERTPDARLIIQAPPRIGKTTLGSNTFSPWYLGKHPTEEVMAVTYSGERAEDIGRRVRHTLTSPRHRFVFPQAVPMDQYTSAKRIEVNGGGSYRGLSFKGGASGRGANMLSIDDPNKGPDQARSSLWQQQIREDWTHVFRPRVNSGGKIVVSMARYGPDDFVGWLLSEDKEEWRVLTCPMVDDDGQPLVPELFDAAACERLKHSVGTRAWETLYQQNPAPDDAPIFNRSWWKFHGGEHGRPTPARFDHVLTMWDLKLKDLATSGSFVCGQKWGRLGADLFLLDERRHRWSFTESVMQMAQLAQSAPASAELCVEDAAAGPVAIQVLKKRFSNVVAIPAQGSKVARAEAIAPLVEAGSVYLPREADWVDAYIEEHARFPAAAHNDRVDTTSHALARLTLAQREVDVSDLLLDDLDLGQDSQWGSPGSGHSDPRF